ncbi:MAG: 30S ribosome-binding factor RbfA [Actinobacteria bacterium]|jgi:ribosome-binding factor A|nr:30S ribosome-binding factor RbfA [Actinomycetota bacterium]
MADVARARQIAERILVIVAETVEMRIKDPRIGFVTFTAARLTSDLREGTVFFTVLGDDDARENTLIALNSAKGVIRTEMGKRLGMKHTPSLTFIPDALPESAAHINALLETAAANDAKVHEQAVGAKFAGDADPYKHPESE